VRNVLDYMGGVIIAKKVIEHGLDELWAGIIGGIRTPLDHIFLITDSNRRLTSIAISIRG
jgi:hypothetical protein